MHDFFTSASFYRSDLAWYYLLVIVLHLHLHNYSHDFRFVTTVLKHISEKKVSSVDKI